MNFLAKLWTITAALLISATGNATALTPAPANTYTCPETIAIAKTGAGGLFSIHHTASATIKGLLFAGEFSHAVGTFHHAARGTPQAQRIGVGLSNNTMQCNYAIMAGNDTEAKIAIASNYDFSTPRCKTISSTSVECEDKH